MNQSWQFRRLLAVGVPIALVAAIAGVAAGVAWAIGADATPYGRADLDAAEVGVLQSARAEADVQTNGVSKRLNARLAEVDSQLGTSTRQLEQRTRQLEQAKGDLRQAEQRAAQSQRSMDGLRSRLEESTTLATTLGDTLTNLGTTATADVEAAAPQSPADGDRLTVQGSLTSTWILGEELEPWPDDCAGAPESYQVRVTSGGETVSEADIVSAQVARRDDANGILSLTCSMTYSATIDPATSDAYEFVAVPVEASDQSQSSATASIASLLGGTGPALYVTFCSEC